MASTVDQAYVEKFNSQVHFLGQQRVSRLFSHTRQDTGTGEKFAFERVASEDMVAKAATHEATPVLDIHSRRYAVPDTWKWGDATDSDDVVRTLIDLNNSYTITAGMAHGRKIDDLIITALGGTALEGDRSTLTALPTAQKIQAAIPGSPTDQEIMTVAKLREARKKLTQGEVWGDRVCVISAEQEEQLLEDPEFTSADYNVRKPLSEGTVDGSTYLGFNFVVTELLTLAGNSRLAYCYVDRAVGLAIADYKRSFIQRDPSISFAWRIYCEMVMNAVRIEETGVVEIETYEA